MDEIWKPVYGLEEFYDVSNKGRVRSKDRWVAVRGGKKRYKKGCVIKYRFDWYGYPTVTLSALGKLYHRKVHRLVAEAFIGPRPDGLYICHYDNNPLNNNIDNLRYATPKENNADKDRHGTQLFGELIYNAKFTSEQIINIRNRRANGEKLKDIAKDYGVTETYIWYITSGEKWKRAGGPITKRKRKVCILTHNQRQQVCEMRIKNISICVIAKYFQVSENQIWNIVKGLGVKISRKKCNSFTVNTKEL